jgi:hypothetical protein
MADQVAWATGKPGIEDQLLYIEADTAADSGRLGKARELSRRAVASAERVEEKGTAAALVHSMDRDVQYGAMLALVFAGDTAQPHALADNLTKRSPRT